MARKVTDTKSRPRRGNTNGFLDTNCTEGTLQRIGGTNEGHGTADQRPRGRHTDDTDTKHTKGTLRKGRDAKQWISLIGKQLRSSKNSRVTNRRSGRSFANPLVVEYTNWAMPLLQSQKSQWETLLRGKPTTPILLGVHLVRYTRRRCDFCNVVQLLQDLMVKAQYLNDDNVAELLPIPLGVSYTNNPLECGVHFRPLLSMKVTPLVPLPSNDVDTEGKQDTEHQ